MWSTFRESGVWQGGGPIFGHPAMLYVGGCAWMAAGPLRQKTSEWLWEAYSGPTDAGRLVAPQLLSARRSGLTSRMLVDSKWLGARTLSAFYLLSRDVQGPWVASRSALIAGLTDVEMFRELIRVVELLREAQTGHRRAGVSPST